MWKRKLYEFAGLQRIDFKAFPPIDSSSAPGESEKLELACLRAQRPAAHPVVTERIMKCGA